jgi:uncharacterized protein YndB with AHSA1/START domain
MKTILHAVVIHAPVSKVYEALTTEAGVTGWWTTRASLERGIGGIIRFTFHGDFNPHMKQVTLEPDNRVEWQCVAGHENWQDNTLTFSLTPQDGETSLVFRQQYKRELADDVYGTYNFNWGYYLGSLKALCETGTGTPFQPPA